jgi:hypothetical protein
VFEGWTAVETETRHAGNREFDRQHITRFAGWEVARCTVDGAHGAVGECLGIEAGSRLGVLVVPEANRVLCDRGLCHCESFRFQVNHAPLPFRSLLK